VFWPTNCPGIRFGQPGTDAKKQELAEKLDGFFTRYADPQYDIWKGGRSKAE
jgi:hypothetical protein